MKTLPLFVRSSHCCGRLLFCKLLLCVQSRKSGEGKTSSVCFGALTKERKKSSSFREFSWLGIVFFPTGRGTGILWLRRFGKSPIDVTHVHILAIILTSCLRVARCCGHTAVKGSVKTTVFDFVHIGVHKSAAASTTTTAPLTGKALKQIVLTGGAGRNRLVLELDGGNTEAEANVVQTWFEVSFCLGTLEKMRGGAFVTIFHSLGLSCWNVLLGLAVLEEHPARGNGPDFSLVFTYFQPNAGLSSR